MTVTWPGLVVAEKTLHGCRELAGSMPGHSWYHTMNQGCLCKVSQWSLMSSGLLLSGNVWEKPPCSPTAQAVWQTLYHEEEQTR